MHFNVYLDPQTGDYSFGMGHPTKAYAKAVRDMNYPRRVCVGTMLRRY